MPSTTILKEFCIVVMNTYHRENHTIYVFGIRFMSLSCLSASSISKTSVLAASPVLRVVTITKLTVGKGKHGPTLVSGA
jgi:hypothetical protein